MCDQDVAPPALRTSRSRGLAALVAGAVLAWTGAAHATAYPCTSAGFASAIAAGGTATFSCSQATTLTVIEGTTIDTALDLDGGGLVTLAVASGKYGITTYAPASFKGVTFTGSTVGGRGTWINATADLTLDSVTFRDNPANVGSTLVEARDWSGVPCLVTVKNSVFSGTAASHIFLERCAANVENTTFDGGRVAVWVDADAAATVRYATVVGNQGLFAANNGGTVSVSRSVLVSASGIEGATSGGYNIITGGTPLISLLSSDAFVTDAGLGALADNGGPTKTFAVTQASPAINFATDAGAPSYDQRGAGHPRVLQGRSDAGAYESNFQAIPVITAHPQGQTLFAGEALSLGVTAIGPVSKSYQWKKDGANINGATGATYTKTAVTGDAGSYTVVVTGPDGSVTSNAATVAVNGPPNITAQPQGATLFAGQALNLSVTASGVGLAYQWKQDGANIDGATSASYTKGSVAAADAGSYTVVVTNGAGS
ncbi:MAG: hypothetical protein CVU56_28175, partial [Deltaproteobacteria bacterium HGW-Deltaproteobacteria-14]